MYSSKECFLKGKTNTRGGKRHAQVIAWLIIPQWKKNYIYFAAFWKMQEVTHFHFVKIMGQTSPQMASHFLCTVIC